MIRSKSKTLQNSSKLFKLIRTFGRLEKILYCSINHALHKQKVFCYTINCIVSFKNHWTDWGRTKYLEYIWLTTPIPKTKILSFTQPRVILNLYGFYLEECWKTKFWWALSSISFLRIAVMFQLYRSVMISGWVNDRSLILGWSIPLTYRFSSDLQHQELNLNPVFSLPRNCVFNRALILTHIH